MENRYWLKEAANKVGWKQIIENKHFLARLILSFMLFLSVGMVYGKILNFIEQRDAYMIVDPILRSFQPMDFTWETFIVMYGGLALAFIIMFRNPYNFMIAMQTYSIVSILRMLTMFLLPIDAPINTIPLVDPFVSSLASIDLNTKDLFFSGHTSTLIVVMLTIPKDWQKVIFLILTILVALFVILQHVHYVIDVFAAPFFTFGAYAFIRWANLEYLGDNQILFSEELAE